MLRVIDLQGNNWPVDGVPKGLIPRSKVDVESVMPATQEIIAKVKIGDSQTILDFSEKFDRIRPSQLRVPLDVIDRATASLSPELKSALIEAANRVKLVCEKQLRSEVLTQVVSGGTVTSKWIPIDRVGLYVPGGRAAYPSSVIMNVVPAQVAGVSSMMIMSPPSASNDGWPHQVILGAAGLLGVTEIYAVGGAQAVAMAAYGVGCEPVDLVTGPGNIFVTAAKRALNGLIAIDSEAGPTEVAVIADKSANPILIAADLISQAEHDVVAAAVLITDSLELISGVQQQLEVQVPKTKHHERITTALVSVQSAAILVDDLTKAIQVANRYAAEHLEIHTENANKIASEIRNAGAVFIGPFTPVSLGDYLAGSNHVLPTAGCACHSSGLSVQSFLKQLTFVEYTKAALANAAVMIETLATAEDLPAHYRAVQIRQEGDND